MRLRCRNVGIACLNMEMVKGHYARIHHVLFYKWWLQTHLITALLILQGEGVPKPVLTFEEASMPEYVLKEVLKQGFSHPTPIQVLKCHNA